MALLHLSPDSQGPGKQEHMAHIEPNPGVCVARMYPLLMKSWPVTGRGSSSKPWVRKLHTPACPCSSFLGFSALPNHETSPMPSACFVVLNHFWKFPFQYQTGLHLELLRCCNFLLRVETKGRHKWAVLGLVPEAGVAESACSGPNTHLPRGCPSTVESGKDTGLIHNLSGTWRGLRTT